MGAGAIKLEQDKEFLNHCSIDIGRNDANQQGMEINSRNTTVYEGESERIRFVKSPNLAIWTKSVWPMNQPPFPSLIVLIEAFGLQLS